MEGTLEKFWAHNVTADLAEAKMFSFQLNIWVNFVDVKDDLLTE